MSYGDRDEIDRRARDIADKGGTMISMDSRGAGVGAAFVTAGVLHVFSLFALVPAERALIPIVVLSAIAGAIVWLVVDQQQNMWFARYEKAERQLREGRPRER